MAIDISALTDYSWADIKIAAKHAMVSAAVGGGQLTISGRMIGRISITEAKKLYEMADEMDSDESTEDDGGTALVQYGERQ